MRRTVLVLLAALSPVLPGTGPVTADPDVVARILPHLVAALGDADRGVRFAAAGALGNAGERGAAAAPALVATLDDEQWCVRKQAARALRSLGPAAASEVDALLRSADAERRLAAVAILARGGAGTTEALRRALGDGDERVRFDACRALVRAEKDEPGEDLLEALRGLLEAKDRPLGIEAAGLLIELGYSTEAVPVVMKGLLTPTVVDDWRMGRMLADAGRAARPFAEQIVELLRTTQDWSLARELAKVLRRFGPEVTPLVEQALPGAKQPGGQLLKELLGRWQRSPAVPDETGFLPVPALIRRLASSDENEAYRASWELRSRGPEIRSALLAALTEPELRPHVIGILELMGLDEDLTLAYWLEKLEKADEDDREEAEWAFAGDPARVARAAPRLLRLLENEDCGEAVFRILIGAGDGVVVEEAELRRLLGETTAAARRYALRRLPATAPGVVALTCDPDPSVRATALWVLSRMTSYAAPPAAMAALSDGNPIVREMAIDVLGRSTLTLGAELTMHLGRDDPIPGLRTIEACGPRAGAAVPALLEMLDDDDPDVRRAVLRAIGATREFLAVPAVSRSLEDPSRDVRIEAAVALGRLGPNAVPALRRALADENWRVRRHAALSLGAIGADAAAAAPDLVARLADETLGVNFAAAEALPRLGAAAARPVAIAMGAGHYGILSHGENVLVALGPAGADAAGDLARLLTHEDVNLREVAARCLGEIGPPAAGAAPALIRALRDRRISVRGRAMVALGRLGPEAASALIEAATDEDARVRAGAVYALGWIVGAATGVEQVPTEVRLPLETAGPGASAVPASDDAIDVLRAGLRTPNLATAIACAKELGVENMDAWEAERAVELLLPECFRPGSGITWGVVYDYLGSGEVAALLDYMALSRISDAERLSCHGALHRIVLSDLLPTLYRMQRTPDAWVVAGGEVWFPRDWSDRFREFEGRDWLEVAGRPVPEPAADGLPAGLRANLEEGWPWLQFTNGWLNDSIPAPRDAPLLLDRLRMLEDEADEQAHQARNALFRALGHLTDPETARYLWSVVDDDGPFALAALARRGDPEAIRRLVDATGDEDDGWDALSLLLEVRPELGADVLRDQLLKEGDAPFGLGDDFTTIRWNGARWGDDVFRGLEEAVLAAVSDPVRLAWIAQVVPGCRTKRMGAAILRGLARTGPDVLEGDFPDDPDQWWLANRELLAFLAAADRPGIVSLMRLWARTEEGPTREFSLRTLIALGDPGTAAEQIALCERLDMEDGGWAGIPTLSRSACPTVETYLRRVAENAEQSEKRRNWAACELAALQGVGCDVTRALGLDEVEPAVLARFCERVLAGQAEEAALEALDAAEVPPVEALGALGTPAADTVLRKLATRRSTASYPKVVGQLSLLGDSRARAELWSAIRVGRYRWICYENCGPALSLGWRPESFPGLAEHLHGNCCRSGHIARLFEEMIGDDAFGYMPHGQDATPARNFRAWIGLHGGRWVTSPIALGSPWTDWTAVPE